MHRDIDSDQIRNCQRGDRQAMEALVKMYERPVYNAAFRMLGNCDDAADVTQNTFLKVFQNIDKYNPKFKFFSWIYRIAMNESINFLNRHPATEALSPSCASPEQGPENLADQGQVGRELQAVLMELTEDYRSVIVLKYFSDCSYQQMADILHIPEKTVKSRLFTARKCMKETLERHGVALS